MTSVRYTDDLSDREWEFLKNILPEQQTGRPVKHELREVLNAIFYLIRTGCSWRNLPKDLPNWHAVYSRFRRWRAAGIFDKMYQHLSSSLRQALNKTDISIGIVDSQLVKITDKGGEHGYDPVKKVNGRKRHIVVDNLGYPLEILITNANVGDRSALMELSHKLQGKLKKICRYGLYGAKDDQLSC